VVSLAQSVNVFGNVLSTGLSAIRTNAVRQLNGAADKLSRSAAGPQPIEDLLLDDRLFGLIDSAIARVGLVLQKVGANGAGAKFYRLPTRVGRAALINLPATVLINPDRVYDVGLIGPALKGAASLAFVVTDAKEIADTYEYSLWPSWKKAEYVKDVRSFPAKFFDFLASQPAEKRLDTLADNFGLDLTPPVAVEMEPDAQRRVAELLLNQAVSVNNPAQFLRSLVDKLHVAAAARGQVVNNLGGDLNDVCPMLVDWASKLSYGPGHERSSCYTVLGALLEALFDAEGQEGRLELATLIESYGLIRDRGVLSRMRDPGAVQ